jgi:hypothetical protein
MENSNTTQQNTRQVIFLNFLLYIVYDKILWGGGSKFYIICVFLDPIIKKWFSVCLLCACLDHSLASTWTAGCILFVPQSSSILNWSLVNQNIPPPKSEAFQTGPKKYIRQFSQNKLEQVSLNSSNLWMARSPQIQMQNVNFLTTGFTGQVDFAVIQNLASYNGLTCNNQFHF